MTKSAINQGFGQGPSEPHLVPITDVIERRIRSAPSAVAILDGTTQLTYGELGLRSAAIARSLCRRAVAGDDPAHEPIVAICLPRGHRFITAMLGVLRSGAAYLPINLSHPAERVATLLRDSGAVLAIADPEVELPESLDRLDPAQAMATDGDDFDDPVRVPEAAADRLAYLMYTSGSTGTPKGVLIEHGSISRLVIDPEYLPLAVDDVVGHAADVAFDATTFEVWAPLAAGARVLVLDRDVVTDPNALADVIRNERLSVLFLTTALLNHVVDIAPGVLASLRCVLFGGEQVSVGHIRRLLTEAPPTKLMHVYGPTETTTFATSYEVDALPTGANIPIGGPIGGTKTIVVDEQGQPVAVGEVGELYIGGAGVARGYLGRPELTAERFPVLNGARWYRTGDAVRRVADDVVEYVRRIDNQVKVRGYRIEPGEVEAALLQLPGVLDAVVTVRQRLNGSQLIGYVRTNEHGEWNRNAPADSLSATLPAHMIPSIFVEMATNFPLTTNGKIDRAALPQPEAAPVTGSLQPSSDIEVAVAALWCQVLDLESVGADVNFYTVGGDSVAAARLAALGRESGLPTTAKLIFAHQTVGAQARAIAESLGAAEPDETMSADVRA